MNLEPRFQEAVRRSRQLPQQSNQTLLELYGLYKQALSGDISAPEPVAFDIKARAKYDAWSACSGMSREAAMEAYVGLVERLTDDSNS